MRCLFFWLITFYVSFSYVVDCIQVFSNNFTCRDFLQGVCVCVCVGRISKHRRQIWILAKHQLVRTVSMNTGKYSLHLHYFLMWCQRAIYHHSLSSRPFLQRQCYIILWACYSGDFMQLLSSLEYSYSVTSLRNLECPILFHCLSEFFLECKNMKSCAWKLLMLFCLGSSQLHCIWLYYYLLMFQNHCNNLFKNCCQQESHHWSKLCFLYFWHLS